MRKAIATALVLCLLVILCTPLAAFAQQNDQTTADSTSQTPQDRGAGYLPYSDPAPSGGGGLFGAIVKMAFSLLIVIGLLYATLWAIRRFTGGAVGPSSTDAVRVVGRIYLSPKTVVYFLRLADELLVIGSTGASVSLLKSIEDEEVISRIESDLAGAQAQVAGPAFSRLFDKSLARFQKRPEGSDSSFDHQLRTLNDQISRLKSMARRRRGDED